MEATSDELYTKNTLEEAKNILKKVETITSEFVKIKTEIVQQVAKS